MFDSVLGLLFSCRSRSPVHPRVFIENTNILKADLLCSYYKGRQLGRSSQSELIKASLIVDYR